MDQWWERHSSLQTGRYTKDEVEDVTGCIPLLLDKCVVDEKIELKIPELGTIADNAIGFAREIKSRSQGGSYEWDWYVQLIRHPGVLLTCQVLRIRDCMLPPWENPKRMECATRLNRPSILLSLRRRQDWKIYVRFGSRCCNG